MTALRADDAIFRSRDKVHIEKVIKMFVDDDKVCEWEMTTDGNLKDFLGINLELLGKDKDNNSSW